MKQKWYRKNVVKALLCIAAVLSFTGAVCSGIYFLMLTNEIQYVRGEDTDRYVGSLSFAHTVQGDFYAIMSALHSQAILKEKTAGGIDRVIDLQAVLDGARLDEDLKPTSGLAYRVADLKKWSMTAWNATLNDGSEQVIVCHKPDGGYDYYYYNDFAKKFMDGDFAFVAPDIASEGDAYLNNYTLEVLEVFRAQADPEVPDEIKAIADRQGNIRYVDFWNYGNIRVKERYAPIGEQSLLDIVNEKQEWNGRLNVAISALENVLQTMQAAQYDQNLVAHLREGNTNLTYFYADPQSQTVYTNVAEYQDYKNCEKALAQMTGEGRSYVLLKPALSECGTTMNIDISEWQQYVLALLEREDFICALSVDETFPVADDYEQKARTYEKYVKWIQPLMAAAVLFALLFCACLIWLAAVAGRRETDEELHVSFLESWYTEIPAGCALAMWLAVMAVFDRRGINAASVACSAFLTAAAFLIVYLNIVRRIKEKTLWKSSLLRALLQWGRKVLELYASNVPDKIKIILTVGVCALLILIMEKTLPILAVLSAAALFFGFRKADGQEAILEGLQKICGGEMQYKIDLENLSGKQRTIAGYVNRVGDGMDAAVENSLKNERMKTELITNVSHDIKTPLTSIINYVDLLKRENLEDARAREYIDVLEKKAQRLKILTEDVVEAAKASTGNISLNMEELDFLELVKQVIGEFKERFEQADLALVADLTEQPVTIFADGRRLWRVLENIFQNAVKYAMKGTRVYVEIRQRGDMAAFSIKNVSAQPLNFSADELTERFIRGDVARNTEGSGLGLSIAKDLTELQNGKFQIYVDGDLFRVNIAFPVR